MKWILVLFCLGCAEAHADPMLVLRWVECTQADPTELFSLSFDRHGDVTFTGHIGTREFGEYNERHSAGTAAHVLREAERLRRHQISSDWASWLCIEVIPGGDRSRAFRVESKTRTAAAFTKDLAEIIPLSRWVCPAPGGSLSDLTDFCSAWYGEPVFSARSPECNGWYSLRAYADGTIYQALQEDELGEDGELLHITRGGYVTVKPRDIDRVLKTLPTVRFDETMSDLCPGGCVTESQDAFAISNPAEVEKFWDTLRQHAPIDDDRFRDTERGHCRGEPAMRVIIPYSVGTRYGARRAR